jgi:hypothetical protein
VIEREEIRFVAAADWTDDARVDVELRKRRMTLTVTEARAFRQELDAAIGEASRAADGLIREVVPLGADVAVLSPDCRDGNKHRACVGTAWDDVADELTNCGCSCHVEAVAA